MNKKIKILIVVLVLGLKFYFKDQFKFSSIIPLVIMSMIVMNIYREHSEKNLKLFFIRSWGYVFSIIANLLMLLELYPYSKTSVVIVLLSSIGTNFLYFYSTTKDYQYALKMVLSNKTSQITIMEWKLFGAFYRFMRKPEITKNLSINKIKRIKVASIITSIAFLATHLLLREKPILAHSIILLAHLYFYVWILGVVQLSKETSFKVSDDGLSIKTLFDEVFIPKEEIKEISKPMNNKSFKISPLIEIKRKVELLKEYEVQHLGRTIKTSTMLF